MIALATVARGDLETLSAGPVSKAVPLARVIVTVTPPFETTSEVSDPGLLLAGGLTKVGDSDSKSNVTVPAFRDTARPRNMQIDNGRIDVLRSRSILSQFGFLYASRAAPASFSNALLCRAERIRILSSTLLS